MQCHLCKLCDARRGGALHAANIWNVTWSTWNVALCGTYCEMGCSVADMKYGIAKWKGVGVIGNEIW